MTGGFFVLHAVYIEHLPIYLQFNCPAGGREYHQEGSYQEEAHAAEVGYRVYTSDIRMAKSYK